MRAVGARSAQQTAFSRDRNRLRRARRVELAEDRAGVVVHRVDAAVRLVRDFSRSPAASQQAQHFDFRVGQPSGRFSRAIIRSARHHRRRAMSYKLTDTDVTVRIDRRLRLYVTANR